MRHAVLAVALAAALVVGPWSARAGSNTSPAELQNVSIDQHLNQQVPLDITFRDETGKPVTLRSLMRGKPVILSLAYFQCPMLCTLVLNGLTSAMRALPFDAGDQFDVITVSFDPKDTPEMAAKKKATYIEEYRRQGAAEGWHFLTGDEASIKKLTDAVGFRYRYLPEKKQFAHAAGIMVLTPEGVLSRYFYGVEFAPRDLKFGLIDAAKSKIGSPVDKLLLYCFQYDPSTGHYTTVVMTAIRIGGVLTLVALGGFMLIAWRRNRRKNAPAVGEQTPGSARQ